MQEYRFMVPECPDGSDAPHPGRRWKILKDALIELAGGYTQTQNVEGAWKDKDGVTCEPCRRFIVSIPAWQMEKLFAMLWLFREKFSQKAIYVSSGGDSWLIDDEMAEPLPEHLEWAREVLLLPEPQ